MQTIAAQLDTAFRTAIRSAFGLDADPLIAVAGNDKFGDYQSNAAMGLSIDKINEYEPILDGVRETAGQVVGGIPERD